jgi:hypothetical protein
MAETVVQVTLALTARIIQKFRERDCVDKTTVRLTVLVENIRYAIQDKNKNRLLDNLEAKQGGKTPMREAMDKLGNTLGKLEDWLDAYSGFGKEKGKLRRLWDYFQSGQNLSELKELGTELEEDCRSLGLVTVMEVSAGVNELIVQQKDAAKAMHELVLQNQAAIEAGRLDQDGLAKRLEEVTKISIEDVKADLHDNFIYLVTVDKKIDEVLGILKIVHQLLRDAREREERERQRPIQECLVMAPFGRLEWQKEGKGRHHPHMRVTMGRISLRMPGTPICHQMMTISWSFFMSHKFLTRYLDGFSKS